MAKSRRGFAAMSVEKRTAIAAKGGKATQVKGNGHHYTPEEARAAALLSRQSRKKRKLQGTFLKKAS